MIPKSLSATSAQVYEECPARWKVEYMERAPQPSNTAADLGTACHEAFEEFVAGGYHVTHPHDKAVIQAFYERAYWHLFADASRFQEGLDLVHKWMARQQWDGRTVLSTEKKLSLTLKTSVGEIPFNYIMDRKDRLANGDIEVVDYKSIGQPLSPEALKHKVQARAYALAAQIEHPEAERVWVTFDLLRFEPIGIVFTKEENRATWQYLHELAERIIANEDAEERLGSGCRFCIRRHVCGSLAKHAAAGGALGITDPEDAAQRRFLLAAAKSAIEQNIAELDGFILDHCRTNNLTGYSTPDYEVSLSVSGRRQANAQAIAGIVGDHIVAKYGDLKVGVVDNLLKGDELTAEQKSRVRQTLTKTFSEPTVKVTQRSPF